jgi:hypothetical protein
MYRALVPALVALTACGGDDGPKPQLDAAVTSTDASSVDAANLCPTLTSCPCFTNSDCPDGFACVSQDSSGTMVSCVAGPRGTGALGATCTTEADCASALCLDTNGGLFCSTVCDEAMQGADCITALPDCTFIAGPDIAICTP